MGVQEIKLIFSPIGMGAHLEGCGVCRPTRRQSVRGSLGGALSSPECAVGAAFLNKKKRYLKFFTVYIFFTSLKELATLIDEIGGEVVVGGDKLVEAEHRQQSLTQTKIGGATQQQQHRREVNVEAVRHNRDNVHVSHHLSVLRLEHVLFYHVTVHV